VSDRIVLFASLRQTFERLLEFDADEVRTTLDTLGISEIDLLRCFDALGTKFILPDEFPEDDAEPSDDAS
jgi:hypothetical protein